jgi:cell division protein FtsB
MQKEMDKLGLEISDTRRKIEDLEKNPRAYETLVREELNYLRPGEKEVRFIGNGKK